MRILIILILFSPLFAFSQINQTDANGLRQGFWEKQQPNGRLMYEGNFKDGKPVGEWKRYHTGGQVKAIIKYQADSDSAFTQLFDEWGKKVAEGMYLNEKKAGLWIYFSEGRKVADEHFEEGEKHGKSRKYYQTGEVWEETDWVHGKQEGSYRVFFQSGEPFFQCKMSNNQRNGLCLTYFQNGRVELEASYKNGLRHGEWKYFDEQGNYCYSLFYDTGKILNPEVRDSISNLQIKMMEVGKDSVPDPEKYMQDPSEYMLKMNIYK
jgi:antitoxin component YwqK of YwqJK toxin-antitoxin module